MSEDKIETPLKFKIKLGRVNKKSPCIVMLHGYGSNEEDLFSLSDYFPKNYIIISFRAPIILPMVGYAWSNINTPLSNEYTILKEAKHSLKLLEKSIKTLINHYNINKKDISLIGFSQGCILSWALAINNPELIRRAVTLSGYIVPELLNIPTKNVNNLLAYNSHGISDEIIPIEKARRSINLIKQNNPNVIYKEYDQGHGINNDNLNDLLEWIKITSL